MTIVEKYMMHISLHCIIVCKFTVLVRVWVKLHSQMNDSGAPADSQSVSVAEGSAQWMSEECQEQL